MSFKVYFPVTDEEARRIVANDAARDKPARVRANRHVRDSIQVARALGDAAVLAQIAVFAGPRQ